MIGGRLLKTSSRVAIAAAAGIFMSGYALSSAQAGGLGGDCCADLEERVAELEATTVRKGNRKVSVKLYGFVNKALLYWNDGVDEDIYVVDNQSAETRIGVKGSAKVSAHLSIGYNLEWTVATARSSNVHQGRDDGTSGFFVRQSYLYFKHKHYGKMTLGHANQPSAGITEIDLSGTKVVATARGIRWNQQFQLRTSTGGVGGTANEWGDVYPIRGHMGGTRQNLVRYDSPSISGFVVSVAWGEDDFWGAALRYAQAFGDIKVAAGISYRWGDGHSGGSGPDGTAPDTRGNLDTEIIAGSLAFKHTPTGLNAHFAAGETSSDARGNSPAAARRDETFWYVKLGITNNYTGLGNTAIYGEYFQADDVNACPAIAGGCTISNGGFVGVGGNFDDVRSRDTSHWGFGVVQHINSAATELYLAYRHYETDADVFTNAGVAVADADIEDLEMVMAGARIKF